mmetsp:Transcript_48438/g.120035  ORF Transcript_48438/g.120035 Transcript_48438/m.120035 type:complete len:229 (-) Transcript_48438:704-1390(-)
MPIGQLVLADRRRDIPRERELEVIERVAGTDRRLCRAGDGRVNGGVVHSIAAAAAAENTRGERGGVDAHEFVDRGGGDGFVILFIVHGEGANELGPTNCLRVEFAAAGRALQWLGEDVDVALREHQVMWLIVCLHRLDDCVNERKLRRLEHIAEARESLRLKTPRAEDEWPLHEREVGHGRDFVDDVAVEVIDRGRRTPRVEVGAEGAGLQQLDYCGKVVERHLLRDE